MNGSGYLLLIIAFYIAVLSSVLLFFTPEYQDLKDKTAVEIAESKQCPEKIIVKHSADQIYNISVYVKNDTDVELLKTKIRELEKEGKIYIYITR